ncbi:MAG: UDP-N-acetylglucosamine 1-carboxyvinyltransferase, partial [Actinobacteria bacterium]
MRSILVRGGQPLTGEVRVEGAKNSALKLIAAALMAPGASRIRNVPDIADVSLMAEVVAGLGARVTREDHSIVVDASHVDRVEAPYEMVSRMRASTAVLGPLLARFGEARVAMPGGCAIGSRSIDMHIAGLEQLGAAITVEHGVIVARAERLTGAAVTLEFPSVGATENLLMAAVLAEGETVIDNAAREPEISDLAAFLRAMGADIAGEGTPEIRVRGVSELHAADDHAVVGDRIEAGTFLAAGALCGGPVTVTGFDPHHLEIVLAKMRAAGVSVEQGERSVTVSVSGRLAPVDVQTLPFPGFPTDMQAQFMTMMALADGTSVVTENVFENRFQFAGELVRMGADVHIEGHHALVRGVHAL